MKIICIPKTLILKKISLILLCLVLVSFLIVNAVAANVTSPAAETAAKKVTAIAEPKVPAKQPGFETSIAFGCLIVMVYMLRRHCE